MKALRVSGGCCCGRLAEEGEVGRAPRRGLEIEGDGGGEIEIKDRDSREDGLVLQEALRGRR